MSDAFPLTPPVVKADGADITQTSVQLAFNQLTLAVRNALNTLAGSSFPPSGPASGDLSGTYPNPTVAAVHATSGTIDNVVIGGLVPAAGTFTTVNANSTFASAGAIPSVTTTGVYVYSNPQPTVQLIDSIRSAGNKNSYLTWGAGALALGFANDAFGSSTNALVISGGQAAGISGITSNSGSGAWAHTGAFSASGGVNSTAVGNTTPSTGSFTTLSSTGGALNGTIGGTTPAAGTFTTVSASTAVGVASGGTGRSTLTNHGVLIGQAAAAINQTAAGTTGQMLLGVTGADPAFGNNPTITGGTIDNAVVGGTTKAAGSFTTVVATGTITPSSTAGIVGTTTNDNANAGSVGEYVSATQASNVSLTTATTANVTSISLTAGDWDVTGLVNFSPSVGMSVTLDGISTVSATLGALGTVSRDSASSAIFGVVAAPTPVVRISISSTTTVYLVCQALFASGTVDATGVIRARRVR